MTKKELKDVFFVRLEELKFQLDREGSIWTMHSDLEIDGENLETQLLDTFNLVEAIDEIDPSTKDCIESLVNDLIETSNKYKKLTRTFVNLTPHCVCLNDGTQFPASGNIARVAASFKETGEGFYTQVFGEVENLPEPVKDVYYIVSAMVFSATDRKDVIAPATGHPECVRNDKGQIVSVPGFVVR